MKIPSRRRRPKQARSKQKVEQVLSVTRRLLEAEGAHALTTNRIAQEVGIGIGSLYEYFPNKQAIVERLIEEVSAEEASAIMERIEIIKDLPLAEAVEGTVDVVFRLYLRNHALFRALYGLSTIAHTVGHRPGERMILEAVKFRLAEDALALGIEDIELAAFTSFHIVESLSTRMAEQAVGKWSIETCIAEITDAVRRYLRLGA